LSGARWCFAAFLIVGCKAIRSSPVAAGTPDAGTAPSIATASAPAPSESGATGWLGTNVAVPEVPPATSETHPFFRKTTLSVEDLTKLVTSAPELARVGKELAFFDPGDGSYITRSSADHEGVTFTSQPVLWSPSQGRQVLVVAAHGKTASFVAAWWVLPDGGYRLASSLVMLGEIAPIALAWRPGERGTLWWTSCWQCPGETGHVSIRDDHHIVIVQD
jgi:hypothetical protein